MTSVRNPRRTALMALGVVVLVIGAGVAWRVLHPHHAAAVIPTTVIARRDIAQTVEATGTVQPIEVVEIKSKASGQILRMPVEVGSVVHAGDLLAQIDTVNVRNQYDEAYAALQAARAQVEISTAQKKRADDLFSREAITADDHETATLSYANSLSSLARARSDLDNARLALADANVRAPSDGTIIEQDATKGTVIASATSSASGGTTLLKMADLNRIQLEALVGETDIGNVWPGQAATVTVDAFPNRPFRGRVLKIEPQAQVQQSVTMFPVLIAIENENGLLLPGMNGEVTIAIAQRTNVIAVPLDAVRTMRELSTVAVALGMNADTLKAEVQRQMASRMSNVGGDSLRAARMRAGGRDPGGAGGRDSTGAGRRAAGMRRGGGGGMGGFAGASAGDGTGAGRGDGSGGGRGAWMARGGGHGGNGGGAGSDSTRRGMGGGGSGHGQMQIAFLPTAKGFEPRLV
ncbi:MAG: efflux RND transporter periplasmic adaptor subunit, partial [Candidatus Eisenbacteria bacterium]